MTVWSTKGASLTAELIEEAFSVMEKSIGDYNQPVFLGMEYGFTYGLDEYTTVEEWLAREISLEQLERFPNAKKAAEIKSTKLYKALK